MIQLSDFQFICIQSKLPCLYDSGEGITCNICSMVLFVYRYVDLFHSVQTEEMG